MGLYGVVRWMYARRLFCFAIPTPWTLPANLLLAVHDDIDYVYIESEGETLILAEALLGDVMRDQEYELVKRVKGSDLVGIRYDRLFDFFDVDAGACFSSFNLGSGSARHGVSIGEFPFVAVR